MDGQTDGQMDKRTSLSDHLIKLRNYTDQREIVIENTECHESDAIMHSFSGIRSMECYLCQ